MSARKTSTSSPRSGDGKAAAKPVRRRTGHPRQEDLADLLFSAHLRITPARIAVLQALKRAKRPLSHADVESALPSRLDRVTVYRTLESFVEAGLAVRTVGADRIGRFAFLDASAAHHEHAHFLCDDCGRSICLPTPVPQPASLPKGFAVTSTDLSFHGHCSDCQDSQKSSKQPAGKGRPPR